VVEMSPIMKIPFILATTYAVNTSLTNPNPPPKEHERRPGASRNTWYMRVTTQGMGYIKGVFSLVAMFEIAAILAKQKTLASYDPAMADRISKLLMKKGTVDNLRLTPLTMAGTLFTIAGCWLRLKCFRTLKEFFTFEISIRDNHRLVKTGPYAWVRHPAYTGSMVVFTGLCCWFAGHGSWVQESGVLDTVSGKILVYGFAAMYTKICTNLLQRMPEEDRLMKSSFGEEWEEWARRVPYWLIPGLY